MNERASSESRPGAARVGPLGWLVRVGLVYPWVWLASVHAVWLVAWAALGRRPRPLLDDPKHIGGWVDVVHTASVYLVLLAVPVLGSSLIAALCLGYVRRTTWRAALLWSAAVVLSWSLVLAIVRFNAGRIVAWYFD